MTFTCNYCNLFRLILTTYGKPLNTNVTRFNMLAIDTRSSFVATCISCGNNWSAYGSMDMLQKVMVGVGVLT